jgi:hypothetical protein
LNKIKHLFGFLVFLDSKKVVLYGKKVVLDGKKAKQAMSTFWSAAGHGKTLKRTQKSASFWH